MSTNKDKGGNVAIAILGFLVIGLAIAAIVLAIVLPHNNPDDIITYPVNANQMAIENTMDKGMVEQPRSKYPGNDEVVIVCPQCNTCNQ